MIVAIPIETNEKEVCQAFGRAPKIMFYDLDSGKFHVKDNAAAESQGGAGLKTAQLILDENVDALITFRLGENAAEVFKMAQVAIYKAQTINVEENLNLLKNQQLSILDKFHAGFLNKQ